MLYKCFHDTCSGNLNMDRVKEQAGAALFKAPVS